MFDLDIAASVTPLFTLTHLCDFICSVMFCSFRHIYLDWHIVDLFLIKSIFNAQVFPTKECSVNGSLSSLGQCDI